MEDSGSFPGFHGTAKNNSEVHDHTRIRYSDIGTSSDILSHDQVLPRLVLQPERIPVPLPSVPVLVYARRMSTYHNITCTPVQSHTKVLDIPILPEKIL